jgi:(heptosyl)LPS beta-1,4-glucosyltransferase
MVSAPAPSREQAAPEPAAIQISVCIVCRNEADRLPACLASVAWADEILVMDLASTDTSAAVARAHGGG